MSEQEDSNHPPASPPAETLPTPSAANTTEVTKLAGVDDDEVDGDGFEYVISETVDGPTEEESKGDGAEKEGDREGEGEVEGEGEGEEVQESKGPTLGYSHGFGGASRVSKEVDEAMREFNVTTKNYANYSNELGRRHTPFEIDLDNVEEQPWRRAGATLDDYFNFGFNEQSWREYAAKQVALRLKELQKNSQLAQANEQMQQQQQPQDGPPQKQRRSMEDTRGGRAPISQHSREAPPRHQRSGGGVGFNGNHIENRPQQPPPPQQQIPPMPQQARPPPLPQAMAAPPLPSHAPPPS